MLTELTVRTFKSLADVTISRNCFVPNAATTTCKESARMH